MPKPATETVSDQDNGWKEMLDGFFESFMAFFFSAIHSDIDWARGYEFLDKELAKLGREHAQGKRLADKLVRVWLRDGSETWLLIHIEVQGRPEAQFNQRTYVYNYRIYDRYGCEVVSLVVVTGSRGARVGRYERGRWGCRNVFEFPVVRITGYRGREAELQASRNPFAMVVLTQLKLLETKGDPARKMVAKRELIRSLARRGYARKEIIGLLRFLDWVMVLPVELEQQLQQELEADEEVKKMAYVTSWERMGFARGLETIVLRLLTRRLGELDEKVSARITRLPAEQLQELGEALLDFTGPQDLKRWLRGRSRTRKRS